MLIHLEFSVSRVESCKRRIMCFRRVSPSDRRGIKSSRSRVFQVESTRGSPSPVVIYNEDECTARKGNSGFNFPRGSFSISRNRVSVKHIFFRSRPPSNASNEPREFVIARLCVFPCWLLLCPRPNEKSNSPCACPRSVMKIPKQLAKLT